MPSNLEKLRERVYGSANPTKEQVQVVRSRASKLSPDAPTWARPGGQAASPSPSITTATQRKQELESRAEELRTLRDEAEKEFRNYQSAEITAGATGMPTARYTGKKYKTQDEAYQAWKDYDRQYNELRSTYYQEENQEQQTRLGQDTTARRTYERAQQIRDDLNRVRDLETTRAAAPGPMTEAAVDQELRDIADRYGIAEEEAATLTSIRDRLTGLLDEETGVLSRAGYDFDRMEEYRARQETAKEAAETREQTEAWAREHPVLSSIASVAAAPLQAVDLPRLIASGRGDENDLNTYTPADPNAAVISNFVTTVRDTVSKDIEENTDWTLFGQNVGSFLYNTGLSIGESASQVALLGPWATYLMGASAASQQAVDVLERGGSNSQAFWGGLAAGAAEAVFEKFSVDRLLSAKSINGMKDLLRETAKQAGTEASEEMLTEISNILTDTAIMGETSNFQQMVDQYRMQGLDDDDAKRQAVMDSIAQVLWAGAGGALSGAAMGGATRGMNLAGRTVQQRQQRATSRAIDNAYDTMQREGVFSSAAREAAGQARQWIDAADRREARAFNNAFGRQSVQEQPAPAEVQAAEEAPETVSSARETAPEDVRQETPQADPLVQTLESGQRVDQATLTNEQFAALADRGDMDVDAAGRVYRVDPSQHIDQRNSEDMGDRKINAFQFDHPEVHQYYREAAAELLDELSVTEKGGQTIRLGDYQTGYEYRRTKRATTERISELLDDFGLTYDQIEKALDAIIHNHGQENIAAAKRVEFVLDDMLTNGYQSMSGYIPPNQDYISAKARIAGYVEPTESGTGYLDGIDDVPETAERTGQNEQQRAEPGDGVSDGDLGRLSGTGTGEQTGGLGEGTERGRGPSDTFRAARERQNSFNALRGEQISSRDLGLQRGTDAKTLRIVPESAWDEDLRSTADRVREETGLETTFVIGGIQIESPDGARLVRGVYTGDRIIVQADNLRVTPGQIADHEIFHDRAAQTPGLILELETRVRDQYGAEELGQVVDRYIRKLRGVVDVTENAGEDGVQAEAWDILEEIFADAYAGINAFSAHAERFNETVEQTMTERGVGRGQQNAAATDRTTGPPEGRQSIDENYERDIDDWDQQGRPDGETFILGATGDVLQGLGAMEQDIYLRSEKVNAILRDHPEMTLTEIKRIPEILEDPVLVLKSLGAGARTENTRMILFGTVRTENGQPVLAVLDLRPVENGLAIDDMQKVNSAYTKDRGAANFVQRSEVMYADEKRTAPLLRSIGLTIASRPLLRSGSMGSISYRRQNVNIQGVPFDQVVRTTGQGGGQRYSFGGRNANRADLEALDRAQDMERRGVAADTIFRETGWFQGADGKWRFEIDDSGMEYSRWGDMNRSDRTEYARFRELESKFIDGTTTQEEQAELRSLLEEGHGPGRAEERQTLRLSDFVRHDDLYQNYPQLRQASLRFADLPEGTYGTYNAETNTITLNNSLRDAPEDTLVHEIQHAIQNAEGFAAGASPDYWESARIDAETAASAARENLRLWLQDIGYLDYVRQSMDRVVAGEITLDQHWENLQRFKENSDRAREIAVSEEEVARYEERLREIDQMGMTARELYQNTAGEIEARDVMARRQLTPEQRRQTMPDTGDENTVFAERAGDSYSVEEYTDEEKKAHARDVLEHFGQTYNWNETGYLTRDGKKVDFSGRHDGGPGGYRAVDHRDVNEALGLDYGGDDYSGAMVQFMAEGNIRISPESGGINLSVPPTWEQEQALSDFISRERGEVILDIDTPGGDTVVSVEYPRGTHANKIINDIRQYFRDGTEPTVPETARFRYSADEGDGNLFRPEGMSDEQYEQLNERWKNRPSAMRRTGPGGIPGEFDSVDAFTSAMEAEAEARLRNQSREDFTGSDALKDLGIQIANSVGIYGQTKQLIKNDQAAKSIRKEMKRAERRLQATDAEKNFAAGVAAGIYGETDIPDSMDADTVMELADYYWAEKAVQNDLIREQRTKINRNLDERTRKMMEDVNDAATKMSSAFVLHNRTPERSMRHIFGNTKGDQINDFLFRPVQDNEAERLRFVNRMHNEVRTFEDQTGKQRRLNKDERALVQLVIEGRAAADAVNAMERSRDIQNAAENIKNARKLAGDDRAMRRQAEIESSVDEAREFGLGTDERRLAIQYSRWLETQERLDGADTTIIDNAVKKYQELFNTFYDATNDFLVAHGYEPIGFIRGYAPHLQSRENQNLLSSALERMGLNKEASTLPASIAGLTKNFRPNMRWNQFFQHRNSQGENVEPDIEAGFESYVDSMSDVLYHTDDIMRVRALVRYLRRTYAPEEIRNILEQADELKYAPADQQANFLRDQNVLSYTSAPSYEDVHKAMEEYVEKKYQEVDNISRYSELAVFLDDYANNLANKQLFEDRVMEKDFGRASLNVVGKFHRAFARAQVSGNLSSALNQGGQLPFILSENGAANVSQALADIARGRLKDWAMESDFLTEKRGIDYLVTDPGSQIIDGMFKPLEFVDGFVSTLAVRSRYLQEIRNGKTPQEAMRLADRYGREVMGSRAKGSTPLSFRSRSFLNQMFHMFQMEALNNWEHISQDLYSRDLKVMEQEKGKQAAAGAFAAILVKMVLGAFLLNRVDEELYGGTPAAFDILGLAGNFVGGGVGLTTTQLLQTLLDEGWERLTGERLFDTEEILWEDFDLASAWDEFSWDAGNEIPFFSNLMSLAGQGDRTLPMPDLSNLTDLPGTIAEDGLFSWEVLRQLMGLAGDILPGGRQIEKSAQGIETLARGGYYRGAGENERLQYPVDRDFWSVVRGTLFGRSTLEENQDFYASGQTGLSAKQTQLYQQLVESGADPGTVYQAIQGWREAANEEPEEGEEGEEITPYLRGVRERMAITDADLTDEQKLALYRGLSGSDSRSDHFQEMMDTGMSWEQVMDAYDEYALLDSDDEATASEKATEFADWVNRQNYTEDQAETVKDALRYWQMIPAEASEKVLLAQEYEIPDRDREAAAEEIDRLKGDGGSVSQDTATEALRNVSGLDNRERAILWQLQNKSWKWQNNPFDRQTGREIYERLHEEE